MVNGGDLGRASAFLKRHDLNTPTLASMLLVDLPDRDFRFLLERRRANSTAAEAAQNWFEKELGGLSEGSGGSQRWKRSNATSNVQRDSPLESLAGPAAVVHFLAAKS